MAPVTTETFRGSPFGWMGVRVVMLDDKRAIVADPSGGRRAAGGGRRSSFDRGGMRHGTDPAIEPVMLCDFGR